jgi:c-di-GMP-binding flagellar brake protein YcgR
MDRLPLDINDVLQVMTADAESPGLCESRVEELTETGLWISWPLEAGERIPISENQALTISFGGGQTAYAFDATVIATVLEPVALLAVRATSPLRSFQRRDDFRMRASARVELTAKVVKIAHFKHASRSPYQVITADTVNISGGGFTIQHSAPVPRGTVFDVALTLPGEHRQPLSLSAQLVRCTAVQDADSVSSMFDLGFSFVRISEAARARIVRFVFSAQREEQQEEE